MLPLVSVIMPCYNAERYIAQSIESVLAQTYTNWELLITDDCSTDNSVNIAQKYCLQDNRINLLVPDEHHGVSVTRNLSISRSQGHLIAFLDSDDVWKSDKLEKQVGYMLEHDIAFTYSSYELIDAEGRCMNKIIKDAGVIDYEKYLRNTVIGCGTVVLDREKTGYFTTPIIQTSQDMALWLSILKKGFKAYPVSGPLLEYRVTAGSATSNKLKAACDVWRVYRRIEKLSMIKSMYCFGGYGFNAIKKRII